MNFIYDHVLMLWPSPALRHFHGKMTWAKISLIGFALLSDRQQGINRTQKRRNSQHLFIIFTVGYSILRHLSAFECG
jgi:hypothetical protein